MYIYFGHNRGFWCLNIEKNTTYTQSCLRTGLVDVWRLVKQHVAASLPPPIHIWYICIVSWLRFRVSDDDRLYTCGVVGFVRMLKRIRKIRSVRELFFFSCVCFFSFGFVRGLCVRFFFLFFFWIHIIRICISISLNTFRTIF